MKRRALLASIGTGALSGCFSDPPDQNASLADERIECLADSSATTSETRSSGGFWPTVYHNFQNTGYSPEENGPTGCVEQEWVWSYDDPIGRHGGMYDSVVVHDSTMYVGDESRYYHDDSGETPDNNTLIALDSKTGEERWRFNGEHPADGTPVIHEGVVYVPGNGRIQAVDAEARELLWSQDYVFNGYDNQQETFEVPVVSDDGYLYAGSFTGDVFGIRADTGDAEWRFETEGLPDAEIREGAKSLIRETMHNGDVCAPLALADDTVFVPTWGNKVYALDRHTGEKRWTFSTNTRTPGDRPMAPVVADGAVYIGTDNGLLYVVDATDGTLLWEFTEKKYGQGVSPGVDDNHVYLTAGESQPETALHAVDRETQEVVWETDIVPPNMGPIIDSESVFIGSGHELVALDKETGELTWVLEMTTTTYAVPAIVNGTVFASDTNGNVYAAR